MIRKFSSIGRGYRHVRRYREIITVLVKHGFGDVIVRSRLDKYVDPGRKVFSVSGDDKTPLTRWERMKMVLEFERSIKKEIDFTLEASHIERFGRNFTGNDKFLVPISTASTELYLLL